MAASLVGHGLAAVRGGGLRAGIDIDPALMTGREAAEALMHQGVLVKETHGSTLRLAPPLIVTQSEIDFAVDRLETILLGKMSSYNVGGGNFDQSRIR